MHTHRQIVHSMIVMTAALAGCASDDDGSRAGGTGGGGGGGSGGGGGGGASQQQPMNQNIQDVQWTLTAINGGALLPSEGPRGASIMFVSRDGTIGANTSINVMGGSYTLKGDALAIERGMMTMMAGPEPLMKQEQAFIAALGRVTTYRVEGRTLTLLAGEEPVLTFEQSD